MSEHGIYEVTLLLSDSKGVYDVVSANRLVAHALDEEVTEYMDVISIEVTALTLWGLLGANHDRL